MGYTGTPPIPEGKIVGAVAPSGLSPIERQSLEAVGWTEDIPIPENMPELWAALEEEVTRRQQEAQEVILPVDPRTKPIRVDPKQLKDVDPETRARFLDLMKTTAEMRSELLKAQQQKEAAAQRAQTVPGLGQALQVAQAAAQSGATEPDAITDDRGSGTATPPAAAPTPTAAAPPPGPGTGAALQQTECPHCKWPLDQPDVPEPEYVDKMAFTQALLGGKPWAKSYEIFGGQATVTYRALTIREIDAVYAQVYRDRDAGKTPTDADFYELVNRYRMFLQLQSLRSRGSSGMDCDLPDGLSPDSNPTATGFWWDKALQPDDTPLPLVQSHIVENVLKTEALFRVINMTCRQFNRTAAKMEAMADNSDFWKPTEAQS